jgi:hypothetical protein
MTEQQIKDCFLEAAELGERFPDLPFLDVIDHVNDILDLHIHPRSVLAAAILMTHETQDTERGMLYYISVMGPLENIPQVPNYSRGD